MALAIGIAVFMFMDLIVATTLIRSLLAPLRELAGEFPARPMASDVVRRNFQSFKVGMLNAGWGFHVAVDDECLHLLPAWMERVFGVSPLSIPWDRVRVVTRRARTVRVMIQGSRERVELTGPAWCLELASPAAGDGQAG
jgi:hypothetical protein